MPGLFLIWQWVQDSEFSNRAAPLLRTREMMYMNTVLHRRIQLGRGDPLFNDQVGVFLLCANRLLREALIRILHKSANVLVVGACGHSPESLKHVIACQPR